MSPDEALYQKVAKKVLMETLRLKKGETLTVETWNNGLPFARRLVVEARRMGANPVTILEDEAAYVEGVKVTPKDVMGTMGKQEYALLAGSDCFVFIPGPPIGTYTRQISREEFTDSTKYNRSWYEAAEKARVRGARFPFGYVGKDYARLYHKKPEDFVRHQLRAALADFGSISAKGKAVGEVLQDGAGASLLTSGGSLEFELAGELDLQDAITSEEDVTGGYNMTYVPPGFVAKEVDPTSVKGKVAVSSAVTRLGLLGDAQLEFEGGRVAGWKSRSSSKLLSRLMESVSPEKRVLSLLQVGLNPVMRYEFGQDRMVSGAVGLTGFGFTGIVRNGKLRVGGKSVVERGRLALSG